MRHDTRQRARQRENTGYGQKGWVGESWALIITLGTVEKTQETLRVEAVKKEEILHA
jgi:hypothetical protein